MGMQAAHEYVLAVVWSVADATWHVTQAAGLLGQPLWHLASHVGMRAAAAVFGSAGRTLLLIAQCSYAIGMASTHVICLLAAIAAELAILSLAAAILVLMMAVPFQIARLVGRILCRLFSSLQILDICSRQATAFWLSLDWCSNKLSWSARPNPILPQQAWIQSMLLPYHKVISKVKLVVEVLVAVVERHECPICFDKVPKRQMVCTEPCRHSYCNKCVYKHFQTKLETNRTDMLCCPADGCTAHFDLMQCRAALRRHKSVSHYRLESGLHVQWKHLSEACMYMRTVATALFGLVLAYTNK